MNRDYRDLTIEHLTLDNYDLGNEVHAWRELTQARLDYTNWLQAELIKAWSRDGRQAHVIDVIQAWQGELDRRERSRREVAA